MTILAIVQVDERVLGNLDALESVVQGITQAVGCCRVDRSAAMHGVLSVDLALAEHAALLSRVAGVAKVSLADRAGH